jgi:hypothetical protein
MAAIHAWTAHSGKPIKYVSKGMNVLTEMYSVFKAEVPDPADPATGGHSVVLVLVDAHQCLLNRPSAATDMNRELVRELQAEPQVRIAGQVGR